MHLSLPGKEVVEGESEELAVHADEKELVQGIDHSAERERRGRGRQKLRTRVRTVFSFFHEKRKKILVICFIHRICESTSRRGKETTMTLIFTRLSVLTFAV
jgi:hypothetical protein